MNFQKFFAAQTPIASIEVVLGFKGEFSDDTSTPIVNRIKSVIMDLNGVLKNKEIDVEITNDVLYVKFALIGRNNVNVAYRLEQMVNNLNKFEIYVHELFLFFSSRYFNNCCQI